VAQPLAIPSKDAGPKAEKQLRQRDEVFRLLVESVKDYAIFLLDPQGRVETWNEGAERIKGYKSHEIIGQHFSRFYPREARESGWPERELEIAAKEGRYADEGWRVKKDGSSFWAYVVITALREEGGVLRGFSKVTRDMTERRDLEERSRQLNKELRNRVAQLAGSQRLIELQSLELQRLSGELLRIQDEERRRIARELHDDLGQQLAALKIELEIQGRQAAGENEGQARAIELTDEALLKVRNLSYLLHPPLLDESGLLPAVHWFIDGFAKRSNLQISFDFKPTMFPRLTRDLETAIFRIIQESLTNIYRHSSSQKARIEINQQSNSVIVRIRDFGRGIRENGPKSSTLGVGISGMKERVKQFGGEMRVSKAEPGTLVEATIPLFESNNL
jgi:PAS domain S-box-containing protein